MTTPNDSQIRAAIKTILDTAVAPYSSVVIPRWDKALVQEGQNLNVGLVNNTVRVWFFSRITGNNTRIGDVPEEPQLAQDLDFTRDCEWTYRFKFLLSYDDKVVTGKTSEDRFTEEIQVVSDALGKSPKLGLSADVRQHDELQIVKESLPGYGASGLCHTLDATLKIHFYQILQFS